MDETTGDNGDSSLDRLADHTGGITSSELLTIGMEAVRDLEEDGISDDLVKQYLDECLLLLIAARDGANGKELLHDLIRLFDADLSSGTVYPRLHALEDQGLLVCHERKRTKQYRLNDDVAKEYLERTRSELRGLAAVLERLGQYIEPDDHRTG